MRRAIITAALLTVCGAARAFDASPLLPWVTADDAWTPAQLGAKLAVWFDASDGATVLDASGNPATNGAPVQTWQDKSGNGRHATAPAEAQRPSYQMAVQNGRSVLRTDNSDFMTVANSVGVMRNRQVAYIFGVVKNANPTAGDQIHIAMWFPSPSGNFLHVLTVRNAVGNSPGAVGRRLSTDSLVSVASSGGAGHNVIQSFADWAGGNIRVSANGGAYASTAYSSGAGASQDADSSGGGNIFGQSESTNHLPANSEIAEVVVVNAAMTDGEIAALESYLKAKWATP